MSTIQTHLKHKMGHPIHGQIAYAFTLTFLSTFLLILALALIFLCKKQPVDSEEALVGPVKTTASPYPLTSIDIATDGFNPRHVLGNGRLGTTYVAVLEGGTLVAVKRIHSRFVLSYAGFGFSSMIKSLSLANHPHTVPILGYSEGPGERIIVTEFIGTMSLESFLRGDDNEVALLDWPKRVRIAAGVARALEYLHLKMAPPVIHGCVKPSNILLDEKFFPRVSDFGLGFMAPPKKKAGIEGYVDEEHWLAAGSGGSKESDVYGFGVVLLELLSGRRSEEGLLVRWALPLIKEMRFGELLDPKLVPPTDMKVLVRLAKVALACVGNSRNDRPSFAQISAILNSLEMEICV